MKPTPNAQTNQYTVQPAWSSVATANNQKLNFSQARWRNNNDVYLGGLDGGMLWSVDSLSQQLFGQPRAIEFVNQNDADELEASLLEHHNALKLMTLIDVTAIPNQSVVSELDFAWHPDELVVRIAAHCPHWGIQT